MNIKIDKELLSSLLNMASIVEARDPYTGGHLWRVAQFSRLLAEEFGLSEDEVKIASIGGFVHDLGKVSIPDSVLLKPSKLTDEEYDKMKTHPSMGLQLIQSHPLFKLVEDAIYQHHEHYNGKGYPNQLQKDEISIYAHIIGITDAFDAMTSTRVYRKGMPISKALSILEKERNEQFHGELVDCMVALNKTDALKHVVGHTEEGIPLVTCSQCGPVIVVDRNTKDGDSIFCPVCTGKFKLNQTVDTFESEYLAEYGNADQMQFHIDNNVINNFIKGVV